jgi:uncharacterized RDD family membrane protein YckC
MNDTSLEAARSVEYAGFWVRLWALIIDAILLFCVSAPLLLAIYGKQYYDITDDSQPLIAGAADVLISWVFPIVVTIWFWLKYQATPGKMLFSLRIVNVDTGLPITLKECIIRYLAYIPSTLVLFLGFIWAAFDGKKQGWHDKIAGTVVVRSKQRGTEAVRFPQA